MEIHPTVCSEAESLCDNNATDVSDIATIRVIEKPIIVMGGAPVEIDNEGRAYVKAAIADYLHSLADSFGSVHFWGYTVPKSGELFEHQLDPKRVNFHKLNWLKARGVLARWRGLRDDFTLMREVASRGAGIIEYHPASGGWPISFLLSRIAPAYVVYFGSDPRKRWLPLGSEGPLRALKRLHFYISGEMAVRLADLILVRDKDQLERLDKQRPGHVVFSLPITAALQKPVRRADSCQNPVVNLFCVCTLLKRKGIEDLLHALRSLKDDPALAGREVHLTLAGGSTLNEAGYSIEGLREMADEMGIVNRLHLIGYVDDMERLKELYQQADIFVLASHMEGFPRVLDEAMAHNLPIVTTNLPEIRTAINDREHALLVEPAQPSQLASAIKEVVCDSKLRQTIMANSHTLATKRVSETATAQHARLLLEISRKK